MGDQVNAEPAVIVEGITKTFKIPLEASNGIKQKLINTIKGRKGYREFSPLNDISFTINKGDFFGIVGRNGSGKSTLLKTIAGIYAPDKGAVHVNGTLVPFIELGVGFNPELTGRENVFLNGALLGFSRNEIEAMYNEIVDFAELHDFMEERLKNFSSGMQVRLAFSIAIKAQGDILLLDEVLAVGDEAFQRKCYQYFAQLKKDKRTVIIVTHDMDSVRRFCNEAILVDEGRIIEDGSVKAVSERYTEINSNNIDQHIEADGTLNSEYVKISMKLKDGNGVEKNNFRNNGGDELIDITGNILFKRDIDKDIFCSLLIKNANGEVVTRISSEDLPGFGDTLNKLRKSDSISIRSKIQNIYSEGSYLIAISLKSIDRSEVYVEVFDLLPLTISGLGTNGYSLRPINETTIKRINR